ncbi:hypothetical protein IF2G_10681 [Cordyceps javanica]|nr:hypothetical protein IF2G_10681 [Cordyceps javanica]
MSTCARPIPITAVPSISLHAPQLSPSDSFRPKFRGAAVVNPNHVEYSGRGFLPSCFLWQVIKAYTVQERWNTRVCRKPPIAFSNSQLFGSRAGVGRLRADPPEMLLTRSRNSQRSN